MFSFITKLSLHAPLIQFYCLGAGNMMGHPAFLSPDGTRDPEIKPEPMVVSGDEGGGGEEEEVPSPTHPRPPSPEPKIEDSECHRSQSAM